MPSGFNRGVLKDGPRTGTYRHGFPTTDTGTQGKISRADVADFMLKQPADNTYLHQTPNAVEDSHAHAFQACSVVLNAPLGNFESENT